MLNQSNLDYDSWNKPPKLCQKGILNLSISQLYSTKYLKH